MEELLVRVEGYKNTTGDFRDSNEDLRQGLEMRRGLVEICVSGGMLNKLIYVTNVTRAKSSHHPGNVRITFCLQT